MTSSSEVFGDAPLDKRYCTMSVLPADTAAWRRDLRGQVQQNISLVSGLIGKIG